MNENGYLTEKDLKFIEALKEDHRINGDKSFFETLFAGLYWVNTSDFKDLLRTIITDRIEFINNIDWLFSFGEGWVVGKYKYHFIILDDGGNIFPYGFFLHNVIDATLNYYSSDREDVGRYEARFYKMSGLDYKKELLKYKNFCSDMLLELKIDSEFVEAENEGFDRKMFE